MTEKRGAFSQKRNKRRGKNIEGGKGNCRGIKMGKKIHPRSRPRKEKQNLQERRREKKGLARGNSGETDLLHLK